MLDRTDESVYCATNFFVEKDRENDMTVEIDGKCVDIHFAGRIHLSLPIEIAKRLAEEIYYVTDEVKK